MDPVAELKRILVSMMSRPECEAFREPVDHVGLDLFDYLDIVKKPMDLGAVLKKLNADEYESVEDAANDIRLVWSNCMLYNRDGSEYYHLADTFSRAFEEAYTALTRLEASKRDENRVPSAEERMQLSYDIFKIDNAEMARVLTIIETQSPSALARQASKDELLINLDALSPQCFHEVNSFVCAALMQHCGGKKKKRSAGVAGINTTSSTSPPPATSSSTSKSKKSK